MTNFRIKLVKLSPTIAVLLASSAATILLGCDLVTATFKLQAPVYSALALRLRGYVAILPA